MPCKPIETLACDDVAGYGYALGGVANLVLWFIIIAVIAWFILWLTKPAAVQTRTPDGTLTGQVDAGKVLVAAIVIALIIVVLIWLFRVLAYY